MGPFVLNFGFWATHQDLILALSLRNDSWWPQETKKIKVVSCVQGKQASCWLYYHSGLLGSNYICIKHRITNTPNKKNGRGRKKQGHFLGLCSIELRLNPDCTWSHSCKGLEGMCGVTVQILDPIVCSLCSKDPKRRLSGMSREKLNFYSLVGCCCVSSLEHDYRTHFLNKYLQCVRSLSLFPLLFLSPSSLSSCSVLSSLSLSAPLLGLSHLLLRLNFWANLEKVIKAHDFFIDLKIFSH